MIADVTTQAEGRILIVDDVPGNLNLLSDALEPLNYTILAAPSGELALSIAEQTIPDLILLDVMMPELDGYETCRRLKQGSETQHIPVIFITARDEPRSIVQGFKVGGVDYVTKPFQPEEVLARVTTHFKIHRLTQELRRKNAELEAEVRQRHRVEAALETADAQLSSFSERDAQRWGLSGLVGQSHAIAAVVRDIQRLQSFTSTSVLITGESGTGKELVARAIHYGSLRARAPFVAVNCCAIPADLAESSFFGHRKGAFSGATSDHKGYFEQAQGGTLFLDEIGDMPLGLQAKLLRVLEDQAIVPVGATQPRKLDVRVLAGTNVNLQADVEAGRFRGDLFFRLARFTIEIPPLRDRVDDIPLLAAHFLRQFSTEMRVERPTLTSAAIAALQAHPFQGNVRELKNLLERALIESGGGAIGPEHLRFVNVRPSAPSFAVPIPNPSVPAGGEVQIERIMNHVRKRGSINNTECRELLSAGLQHASYLLCKAQATGLLERSSSGRWARYHLPGTALATPLPASPAPLPIEQGFVEARSSP
jgi:DNA-binding NtrC family response regulator